MTFLVDQLRFLGLSDKEVRVFTALSTFGRMTVSKTAKRAGLPRTTVDYILKGLTEQGVVLKERVGGHVEYSVQLEAVADTLDSIEKRLRPGCAPANAGEQEILIEVARPASVTPPVQNLPNSQLIEGAPTHEMLHEVAEYEFSVHAGERVIMLTAQLVSSQKRMERFEHCLVRARQAHIKLEMLTTTEVAGHLSEYATDILALLTAYDLRLNFLPPSFCIEQTDVVAFRDVVLIVDHHADVIERITGLREVALIKHLLHVAREAGWGMDMKMWLEGVLASRKEAS